MLCSLWVFACSSSDTTTPAPDAGDPSDLAIAPKSCSLACPSAACAESTTPYSCPALGDWRSIPHDVSCPKWDGATFNATPSKCTVSVPSADAIKLTGADPDDPKTTILPDGRRSKTAGAEWLFDEPDLNAGLPVRVVSVPGSTLALVVDAGHGTHSVRLVDTAMIASGQSPVLAVVEFPAPQMLWQGIAVAGPDLVLVATNNGVVQALKLDVLGKTLVRDVARNVALPASIDDTNAKANYWVSGLAVSPDQKTLVVSSMIDTRVLVFDLTNGNYGKALGSASVGQSGTFDAAFDPNDPQGRYAYVSRIGARSVVELDLSDRTAPKVTRTFSTDKDPQGMAFLDARYLAVVNAFGDTLTVIDRASGASTSMPIDSKSALHGTEPTTLAMDPVTKRLYATLAGRNAIGAWSVDTSQSPAKLVAIGRLPTSWWPSSVAVTATGDVLWTSARGHSNGPLQQQGPVGDGAAMHGVRGGVAMVATPQPADLSQGDLAVDKDDDVFAVSGSPQVTCPNNENDFALPPTNTAGPSQKIKRIVFIVRENKTFDGVLGDLAGVRGDPSLTLKKTSADMDKLWLNFRQIARTFATSDNYHTSAELSIQGHFWSVYGRSSDFMERTWQVTGYSRSAFDSPVQPQCVNDVGEPQEGSLFDWLSGNHVKYAILGEACGIPQSSSAGALDTKYPGGFIQSIGYPDVEKACYLSGRLRALCDVGPFVYMTLPNDHTRGVGSDTPSPEVMVAVNDEATGMVVEAISRSPWWAESLVVVTEDDPADGGDHVDHHRVPVIFASPWIKRGYVSRTHIDTSSLHKMFAHILGLPYPSVEVEKAALPLDLFSSTPDLTPFAHQARKWPLSCGEKASLTEKRLTQSWDLTDVDEQPGLDDQVRRVMRGEELQAMPAELQRQIELRADPQEAPWRR